MADATRPRGAPVFDISPEVVFRLGDELITDELQALTELVKNSYDASAMNVTVRVSTEAPLDAPAVLAEVEPKSPERQHTEVVDQSSGDAGEQLAETDGDSVPEAKQEPQRGYVEIVDDGDGMTRDRLDRGWLLISSSQKRTLKEQGRTNRLGRTPLGDKGLGRLGVLRLGTRVEIRTRPRDVAEEHILRFDRADFESREALSDIDLHYERRDLVKDNGSNWHVDRPYDEDVVCAQLSGPQGTVIRVSGLNNVDVWTDRAGIEREMLSLISPFKEIDSFSLLVYIDDPTEKSPLELGKLADIRRDLADSRWSFSFERGVLRAIGRFKLGAFQPSSSNEELSAFWSAQVAPDGGSEYRRRVVEGPLKQHETSVTDPPWWLAVTVTVTLADVAATGGRRGAKQQTQRPSSAWSDPGPFSGEIDSFSLARDADLEVRGKEVFESFDVYRRWIHLVRGMKVFRDGFGIRVGEDFLGLGAGFTGARSFYSLRPGNVVGYIALSAAENAQLQETTDREGFVANPPYRTFEALLRTLVDRINVVQSNIGRELREWTDHTRMPIPTPPSQKAEQIARAAAAREAGITQTIAAVSTLERTLSQLADGGALLTPAQAKDAREATELLGQLQQLVRRGQTLQADLDELAASSREVERERAQLRDQLRVAYQTIGLGIVAETVSHELTNITGRLLARADALAPQFKGPEHKAARALATEVRATVRAIRLQLRHLEPQLRYQRIRREKLDVHDMVTRLAEYHRNRLTGVGIAVDVEGVGFQANVNRGRAQQALDNLIINSEFWLRHAPPSEGPRIDIRVEPPLVLVRDNGPGIDPGLETAIFEPFVSGRTGDEGRGLGLFITRQVLQDDGVTITLGERDPDGRRRTFVLDFTSAIPDSADA